MKLIRIFLAQGSVMLAMISFLGCPKQTEKLTTDVQQANTSQPKTPWVHAKVVDMSGLDGCRLLLELPDGKRLQPINLDKVYQKEGLKLRFTYKKADGYMGICMAGDMVELLAVELVE